MKQLIKTISVLIPFCLLAACGGVEKIDISSKPVDAPITQPDNPKPIKLYDVTFKVVTAENLNQFIAAEKAQANNDKFVFVAISIKDYENLALNLEELKRYIEQQKALIVYYKTMTAKTPSNPK
jgi:hypothetical protein